MYNGNDRIHPRKLDPRNKYDCTAFIREKYTLKTLNTRKLDPRNKYYCTACIRENYTLKTLNTRKLDPTKITLHTL
jgi:hypothetical protein